MVLGKFKIYSSYELFQCCTDENHTLTKHNNFFLGGAKLVKEL
jgi:hypothetical protein